MVRTYIERELLRLEISEDNPRASSFLSLFEGLEDLYDLLWWLGGRGEPFERPSPGAIPDAEALKIERIHVESPGIIDLSGLGEPIRELREFLKDLRFRSRHEKTEGELRIIAQIQELMRSGGLSEEQILEVTQNFLTKMGALKDALEELDVQVESTVTPRLPEPTIGSGGETGVHCQTLGVRTTTAPEFVDITDDVRIIVTKFGVRFGQVTVYSTHTTAAIKVNENDPVILQDLIRAVQEVAQSPQSYHLFLSTSETIPIVDGELSLGQWQRIFLVELERSGERRVLVNVVGTFD